MKLSVILPFYNAEKYFHQALDSVLASTFLDYELVLIDDGSNDGSEEVAAYYASTDSRIRLVSLQHTGLVTALNTGIRNAESDIIVRMDADDVCHPDRLEQQFNELVNNPDITLTSSQVDPVTDNLTEGTKKYLDWVNNSLSHDDIMRDLYRESPLPHPTVMFRKKAVVDLGGYREYNGPEDYDLWLRMADAGYRFSKIPLPLLQWRIYENSHSRTHPRYRKKEFMRRSIEYVSDHVKTGKLARGKKIFICGTDTTGKILCRTLQEMNINVEGFIDIDENMIGRIISSVRVHPVDIIEKQEESFFMSTVKSWGARDQIRGVFTSSGLEELRDYVIL